MTSEHFWAFFENEARPWLGRRARGFEKIFRHLESLGRPVWIVETGATRSWEAREHDGGSTVLFDTYVKHHEGSVVFSIDTDPAAIAYCRAVMSGAVHTFQMESTAFLRRLASEAPPLATGIDLLYLDTHAFPEHGETAGSTHVLHEVMAAMPMLTAASMVAVDDAPLQVTVVNNDGAGLEFVGEPVVGGNGRALGEYAQSAGAHLAFREYQTAWTRLRQPGARSSHEQGSYVCALVTDSQQGVFMVDARDQFIGRDLALFGRHADDELAWLRQHLRPEERLLVVGSHVGTLAIPLAKHCKEVVAVEANPTTYRYLRCNMILNDVTNMQAFNVAGNDRVESLRFVANTVNSGGSKRFPVTQHPMYFDENTECIDVPAARLDDTLPPGPYAMIVMDIEGSEVFALRGMPKILAQCTTLAIEFIPHHLALVANVTLEEYLAEIEPYFEYCFIPDTNEHFRKNEFRTIFGRKFEAGTGHMSVIFSRNPLKWTV